MHRAPQPSLLPLYSAFKDICSTVYYVLKCTVHSTSYVLCTVHLGTYAAQAFKVAVHHMSLNAQSLLPTVLCI